MRIKKPSHRLDREPARTQPLQPDTAGASTAFPQAMSVKGAIDEYQSHWVTVGLLILGLLAFVLNLRSYFLADDFVLLSWTHVHTLQDVAEFFNSDTWWFYRPLVKLIYWLSQTLFGLQPLPLHLLSLIFHALNAFLVYYLLVRQLRSQWSTGLAAALLFLLNAHHAETVSWIAAIGELAATSGILGALICFQRFCARGKTRYWLASLGLFALALLARESGIMLPAVLLLDTLLFARTRGWSAIRRLIVASSYGVIMLGYGALQLIGRSTGGATGIRGGLEFHVLSIDSVLLGILDYVHGLIPGGNFLAHLPLETLRIVVWIEWLLIVTLAILLWRLGQRVLLYGLGWLLITPLLFIFFNTPADRYFYLPSIGYAILIAGVVTKFPQFIKQWRPLAVTNAKIIAAGILVGLLLIQSRDLFTLEGVWITNGQTSAGIIHDIQQAVPDPRNYSAFYFVGVPATLNGVPLFSNGLPQAVQLAYADNRTLLGVSMTCAELQHASLPRYSFFFQYKGGGVARFVDNMACH